MGLDAIDGGQRYLFDPVQQVEVRLVGGGEIRGVSDGQAGVLGEISRNKNAPNAPVRGCLGVLAHGEDGARSQPHDLSGYTSQ